MNEQSFWNLISEAKAITGETAGVPDALEKRLSEMSLTEIADFAAWLSMFLNKANDKRVWLAGAIITGSMSDDGFVYFRCWLVAQGKSVFESAINNPDSLSDVVRIERGSVGPFLDLEELLYVADNAFKKVAGKPMRARGEIIPEWLPPADMLQVSKALKNANVWDGDQSKLKDMFPNLFARYRKL